VLIGREREQRQLAAVLEEARRGRSAVLVLVGGPGVGKSALLEDTREAAGEMWSLSASGVESESELAFASLHELLRPLLPQLPAIPSSQRRALEAALALADGAADPLAVRAGTLSLLAAAAEERPLLLLLDDVQWFDDASADSVAFAVRRLRAEAIAVVAARRPGTAPAFERFPAAELGPLGPGAARALLRARRPLPAAAEHAVLAAAAGNPLVLLELPPDLADPPARAKTRAHGLERAFAGRLDELSSADRHVLVLAAAEPDRQAVAEAAGAAADGAFAAAELLGLVRLDDGAVTFRHPVVRALVYAKASSDDRAAAHRELAEVLLKPADVDRRAWHLGAALSVPDGEVAALLEQTAERAILRGGHAAAARALHRAAELSPEQGERVRRLALAATYEAAGGHVGRARALIEEALPLADDPLVRFDLLHRRRVLAEWTDERESEATLLHELETNEALDADRRLKLLILVVNERTDRFDAAGAVELVPRIEALLSSTSPLGREYCLMASGLPHLLAGNRSRAVEIYRQTTDPATPAKVAFDYISLEWWDELRSSLTATTAEARRLGDLHRVTWNQSCAAHLELRHGRLDQAEEAAAEALRVGELLDDPRAALASAAFAAVRAWRGETESCLDHGRRAVGAAGGAGDRFAEGLARDALALLALGRGRPEDAVSELAPLVDRWRRSSVRDPAATPYVPNLVEAYLLTDRRGEAEELLERFSMLAEAAGNTGFLAACARCRGLLADDFEEPFEEALELLGASPYALELARTQLALGERRRRAGRRADARAPLRAALDAFAAVRAQPWQQRAAAELRATGVAASAPHRTSPNLTPQEIAIAALVAEGKSNKEIGAAIYLSPKTVEYHLANTFRKLDIHSRAELARIVAQDGSS